MKCSVVILFLAFQICISLTTDEIQSLPGLKQKPSFKQYSGYLSGGEDVYLHYWFVESQSNPAKDPVILWLNGGPGCSSIDGLLTENGPFRVQSDGKTVTLDPNSWNTLANVIFLESPVGVGYSYYNKNKTFENDDDNTARMNHLALEDFFKKFPQFSKNPFYITGESYACVYIPMLAIEIFSKNSSINLKGVAIGNGALDDYYLTNSAFELALGHGLVDDTTMKALKDACCHCNGTHGPECYYYQSDTCNPSEDVWDATANIFVVNAYNVLDDCGILILYERNYPMLQARFKNKLKQPSSYASKLNCPKSGHTKWLNLPEVRKALNIPNHLKKWSICSNTDYNTQKTTMKPEITDLVEKYKLGQIIIYNGDLDMQCDFLGCQRFVDSFGYILKDEYQPWYVGERLGGFVKRYAGITFTTVRGAGHMVPTDKPEAALEVIKELIGIGKLNDK